MIVMDKKDEKVYFDSLAAAKAWIGCDDENVTTANDLEEWTTKKNGGIVAHTFEEVE